MSRHEEITSRKPESVNKAAANITYEDIKQFIEGVIKDLQDKDLLEFISQHPQNVLNMDESSFSLNALPDKVLTSKEIPHTHSINNAKHHERIAITVTVAADGSMLTPQIIFRDSFGKIMDVVYASGG
jgi:tagatose-1,6-bisphosphate aldolase